MQFSPNQKTFYNPSSAFLQSTYNMEHFEKKDEPQRLFFSHIIDFKKRGSLKAWKASCQNTYGQSKS